MQPVQHNLPQFVVLIGASAGGLEALGRILPVLPAHYPAAVVVMLHQAAGSQSLLPEIFAHRVALPVKEADDKEHLQAGTIYFAPPSYHLLLEKDVSFSLSKDPPVHFCRPAIDILFDSAADALGPLAVGVLLSGANEDGAAGLAHIAREGGVTLVQRPSDAQIDTMPASALALFTPDHLLSAADIGKQLAICNIGECRGTR
ncbi:Chemotaxis response regulator protein-glutamate methylesterase [Andreprevotia sp. IGB-42]|nr:Chemotaxis response regulator protein-glutamate methylesterase [Andreprevotia sp. IGB-42]